MESFAGKKILVTGVLNNRSIAHAIASELAARGATLALSHQPGERLQAKVEALAGKDFPQARLYPLDVASDEQCDSLAAALRRDFDTIDGFVHSIAYVDRGALDGSYHERTSRADFAQALDISAYSLTALASRLAGIMPPGAAIVCLTYIGSQLAIPNYNVMGVAKAALESSVRYLAASLGPAGVRVNAISAGPIKTLAASGISGLGAMLRQVAATSPLRRNITGREVGAAAAFLLGDAASGITGEIIHVDAGAHISSGIGGDDTS